MAAWLELAPRSFASARDGDEFAGSAGAARRRGEDWDALEHQEGLPGRDGAQSLIREQVEMGVAVRMAVLEALARNLPNG